MSDSESGQFAIISKENGLWSWQQQGVANRKSDGGFATKEAAIAAAAKTLGRDTRIEVQEDFL